MAFPFSVRPGPSARTLFAVFSSGSEGGREVEEGSEGGGVEESSEGGPPPPP